MRFGTPQEMNVWLQESQAEVRAVRSILAERERELLELKGPCSSKGCCLHYAHSGPCDISPETTRD